jgi:adenylate cyclase
MKMQASSDIFLFADFRLDRAGGGLFRRVDHGAFAPVTIGSRALDLLAALIERRGDVVSKEEIMAAVWPKMAVEEANLFVQISALRTILDKEQPGQSCIQTVTGRGYRFITQVTRCVEARDSDTPPGRQERFGLFPHDGLKPSVPSVKARSPEPQPSSISSAERPPKRADPAPATEQRRSAVPAFPLALAPPDKHSIAVLPFQNMSGDPEQDYFADGMAEDIVTGLSRIKWLFVIARNSTAVYKGRAVDVRQVGRELGVRYLLEGGVRKSGRRLRITAQLVEAESGAHLWADKFDGEFEDVFDLQDRITERVVGIVEPSVQNSEIERSRRKRPESLDAYDLYLRALPFIRSLDPESAPIAAGFLGEALKADPNFALAHAYLAWSHQIRFTHAGFDEAEKAAAMRHAPAAIADEVDDATALAIGAYVIGLLGKDAPSALEAIERALTFNPSSAAAHFFGGFLYAWSGDPVRGTDLAKRALRLSPFDPRKYQAHLAFGVATFHQGRYEESAAWWEKCSRANPKLGALAAAHSHALALAGRMKEAKTIFAKALELEPSLSIRTIRELGYAPEIEALWIRAGRLLGLPE